MAYGIVKRKPTIFVFPTFLAVGGVERNTVDVIASLRESYDFVVVTFERLSAAHGSLHHQFFEHCVGVFDLTEIGTHNEILGYLRELHKKFRPDLIWICNGSPWMAANTSNIRNIFEDAAIVDQQAYDTDYGWVSLYRERNPGLLAFERFIAINSKINDVFTDIAGIPREKIDLIYSVISAEKRAISLTSSVESLREKFGLEAGRRYFASIGRLTSQKGPLDFVSLIDFAVKNGPKDLDFLIVGSGEMAPEVESAIAQKGLGHRVKRISYVQNSFELSRVIDAIVFTSHYEGLPIALLEALSLGTPGLCTDVGDIGLVFERYGNGLVFEKVADIESLQHGFTKFMADYGRFKNAAVANAEAVAVQFSMKAIQQQYRACFQAAMKVASHGR